MSQQQANERSETETVTVQPETSTQPSELVLHLEPQNEPRVRWAQDTVDNEFMGKKKSKCCCIYKKPKKWDESSDEEDSDCETGHCRGHVEKKHEGGEQ
ncbi:unnamed protein product [Bursaphelenchus okinawaensis]|uniref:E3 ubiquitin-protein ligase PPP1R11 n=1 Tax=Bursaphelenchus okinawaensis TaxID=465554 RepID=A0A811LJM2_9BILA|nr:unnamed protein product [Bursaphelenchus okinawaensis]CAG9124864.1 unnamed protein product [Bursaphelenchus okinawaensis]